MVLQENNLRKLTWSSSIHIAYIEIESELNIHGSLLLTFIESLKSNVKHAVVSFNNKILMIDILLTYHKTKVSRIAHRVFV
jgi:hypothetical protein